MKTIDKLKERLLCNPKIKMFAFNFPAGTGDIVKLSDVLQKSVPEKYFLSEEATKNLLEKQTSKGARIHSQEEVQEDTTEEVIT